MEGYRQNEGYGTEAVIPIEVEIPSLRVLIETQQDEAE